MRINIVSGTGQPRRLRRQRGRPGRTATPAPRSSCGWCAGCGPRRTSPTRASTSRSPTRPWCRASEPRGGRRHPKLYFGGASRGRRAGRRDRGRRPAVLGRAAGRRARADRAAEGAQRRARPRAAAAGVRPADHHPGARHHRAGLGRRRGQGRRHGQRPGHVPRDSNWQPPSASSACSAGRARRGAGRQPLHRARQVRRRRRRHDLAGRLGRRTWRARCANTSLGITHFVLSDTPYLREIKRQGDQLLPLLRG